MPVVRCLLIAVCCLCVVVHCVLFVGCWGVFVVRFWLSFFFFFFFFFLSDVGLFVCRLLCSLIADACRSLLLLVVLLIVVCCLLVVCRCLLFVFLFVVGWLRFLLFDVYLLLACLSLLVVR